MNIDEAKIEVISWLENGGEPNTVIPFKYNYVSPFAERGFACVGAALAYLTGERGCMEVGETYYDNETYFFNVSRVIDVDSLPEVTQWAKENL